ncbi:MAG: hypothetical protein QXG65_00465 [Thermoplasmata archaeon]
MLGLDRPPLPSPPSPGGVRRIPCAVPDFDYFTGGFPAGSVVLLLGEPGAGHVEFALTSAVGLMRHAEAPEDHPLRAGRAPGPIVLPTGVLYISLTRTRDQVLTEIRAAFDTPYPEAVERHLSFRDLSAAYFRSTPVPESWSEVPGPLDGRVRSALGSHRGPDDPLGAVAGALDDDAAGKVVILDSLGDLVTRPGIDLGELLTFLKGLRRRAKVWDGLVYLLLPRGIATPPLEQAIGDSVDGILSFGWSTALGRTHRERTMAIERFLPVLAHVAEENQGRFVVRVQARTGLVTTQHERL